MLRQYFVKELEDYVLSDFSNEAFKSLIPGTKEHFTVEIIKNLREYDKSKSEALLEKFKEMKLDTSFNILPFMQLLKEYDLPQTTSARRTAILTEISTMLGITYNHVRNQAIRRNAKKAKDVPSKPSFLDVSLIDLKAYHKNKNTLLRQCHRPEEFLDFAKLNVKDVEDLLNGNFQVSWSELPNQKLEGLLNFCLTSKTKDKKPFSLVGIIDGLTVSQIELILEKSENSDKIERTPLFLALLERKYVNKLENTTDLKEKKALLNQLEAALDSSEESFYEMKSDCYLKKLSLSLEEGVFDVELFIKYLKNPSFVSSSAKMSKKEKEFLRSKCKIQNKRSQWVQQSTHETVITKHLEHFAFNGVPKEKFSALFEADYLKKIYSTAAVLKGDESSALIKDLGLSDYESLVRKVELTIIDKNKTRFDVNEIPYVNLKIKGIEKMFIKIYEVNTENYYYTQKKAIGSNISFEGLIPSFESTLEFTQKQQEAHFESIELTDIPNRRGVFVAEMIGQNITSRAVIKKGGFNSVIRNTSVGFMVFILDENQEVCTGENTGIFFDGTFYQAAKGGEILIPYGQKTRNGQAILVHEGFAELDNFSVPTESVKMEGIFLFDQEAMVPKNKPKIVIVPQFYVNSRPIDRKLLKKGKFTVSSRLRDSNIPLTETREGLVLKEGEDPVVEFEVHPKTETISMSFETAFKLNSTGKEVSLKMSESVSFTTVADEKVFTKMFVSLVEDNFVVNVLRKNGEPVSGAIIKLSMNLKDISGSHSVKTELETDENGQVHLGKLKTISSVTACLDSSDTKLTCSLFTGQRSFYSLPDQIDLLEGETLKLPAWSDNSACSLIEYTSDMALPIRNESGQLREEELPRGRKYVCIDKAIRGHYLLKVGSRRITLNVYAGKHWISNNFIVAENKIIENSQEFNPVHIKNIEVTSEGVNLQLGGDNKVRAHFFLSNSISESFESRPVSLTNSYRAEQNTVQSMKEWKNFYLSNKKLHDEIQYILDRKNQEAFLGNSLEKPSLLFKRKYIRDTYNEDEVLSEGGDFNKMDEKRAERDKKMRKQVRAGVAADCSGSEFFSLFEKKPVILANIRPDSEGWIKLTGVKTSDFNMLRVFAVGAKTSASETVSLKGTKIETKNLILSEPFAEGKYYAELKHSEVLTEGKEHFIEDFTSTKYKILDSLKDLLKYQTVVNPSLKEDFLDKLLELPSKSEKELKTFISEHFCSELSIFLYFKMPETFNKLVKPLIKYKAEKHFIDYFLMGNEKKLETYLNPELLTSLNPLEKCLLIIYFRKTRKEECKGIAKNLKIGMKKVLSQEFGRFLDVIINLKSKKEEELMGNLEMQRRRLVEQELQLMEEEQNCLQSRECYDQMECMDYMPVEQPIQMNAFSMAQANYNAVPMRNVERPVSRSRARDDYEFREESYSSCIEENRACKEDAYSDDDEDDFENCEEEDYYGESCFERAERRCRGKGLQEAYGKDIHVEAGCIKEYSETHSKWSSYFAKTQFWVDYAEYLVEGGDQFLSKFVLIPAENHYELVSILSVIGLPFNEGKIETTQEGATGLRIKAVTSCMLFTKGISETEWTDREEQVMINFNLVDTGKNTNCSPENDVYIDRVYKLETIVTNVSAKNLEIDILTQIPEGAVPTHCSPYSDSTFLSLNKFSTTSISTHFYFPSEGKFKQFCANISLEGKVFSKGESTVFSVQSSQQTIQKDNLQDVLENGTEADIIQYFQNAKTITVSEANKIIWMLAKKESYTAIMAELRKRNLFMTNAWKFAFKHGDETGIKEYLEYELRRYTFTDRFESTLYSVDSTNNDNRISHLDYDPVFNARVHFLGDSNEIMNVQMKESYQDLVMSLSIQSKLVPKDYLRLSYYLVLQERVEEALKLLERVDCSAFSETNSLALQYDYLKCYIDFFYGLGKAEEAKKICAKYAGFPLTFWREMFEEVENQIIEFEGKTKITDINSILDEEKKTKERKKQVASALEHLDFTVEGTKLKVICANLDSISFKFYMIDLEILFSKAPFLKQSSEQFSFIQPHGVFELKVPLSSEKKEVFFDIPSAYHSSNVCIEARSKESKSFQYRFSTSLKVSVTESLGEVHVADAKMANCPKVYVKVFSMNSDGSVNFYKDGYTDIRGSFNYLELNTGKLNSISKLALFVSHDSFGSVIREVSLPNNIQSDTVTAQPISYEALQGHKMKMRKVWRSKNIKR